MNEVGKKSLRVNYFAYLIMVRDSMKNYSDIDNLGQMVILPSTFTSSP